MKTELEAKWLDIDPRDIRTKLRAGGAALVHAEILMRRKNFDYPDKRLEKIGGWVRVRNEGKKITLSYKQLNDRTLHGTKEVAVIVDDFERTCEFLRDIGLREFAIQETRREAWQLGSAEIVVDSWPWIPPFVEIESPDEPTLRRLAERLGLRWDESLHGSVEIAYQAYYDVTDQEIYNCPAVVFGPVPSWLAAKRKKQ
ncbi:MAG: CYTH domain-containing protein [Candidatus Kerfeldbacteria bacterium]|nr:CYTH domain-containing protein [Candidatus Kerfeldbacteria bacterium]